MSETLAFLGEAARHLCVIKLCLAFDSGVAEPPPAQNDSKSSCGLPSVISIRPDRNLAVHLLEHGSSRRIRLFSYA